MGDVIDEIVGKTTAEIFAGLAKVRAMPLPEGDDRPDFEFDDFEGMSAHFFHYLWLAVTPRADEVAALTAAFRAEADRRWGPRRQFDANAFTDTRHSTTYDARSAPASVIRAMHSGVVDWWEDDGEAIVLVDNSAARAEQTRAGVMVLMTQWLTGPAHEEQAALTSPVVADALSGDRSRILAAVWQIIHTRDPEVLRPAALAWPAVLKATEGIDLGGAFVGNASHLAHAGRRLELFQAGACLCADYVGDPKPLLIDPEKEAARGHVTIDRIKEVPWSDERICTCTDCGRRFHVQQGEYHYTWWEWTLLPEVTALPSEPRFLQGATWMPAPPRFWAVTDDIAVRLHLAIARPGDPELHEFGYPITHAHAEALKAHPARALYLGRLLGRVCAETVAKRGERRIRAPHVEELVDTVLLGTEAQADALIGTRLGELTWWQREEMAEEGFDLAKIDRGAWLAAAPAGAGA